MGKMDDADRVPIEALADWTAWLETNADTCDGVWMVLWRPATERPRIDYDTAIREALCFGWIDGQAKPLDDERSMLWFAPRAATSAWAGTNKARIAELIAEGRMRPAGQRLIDLAKENGTWELLDGPEAGIEPPELAAALDAEPTARATWDAWTPGVRKAALTAIALARRPETKTARIERLVADAAAGRKPA
jgi:uncharacterized protein YdeI (YjbR/CyaY-like superfamily)